MPNEVSTLLLECTCGQKMKVPAKAIGKTATCVKCGKKIKLTRMNTRTEDAEQPAAPTKGPPARKKATPELASGISDADNLVVDLLLENNLVTQEDIEEARVIQKDILINTWEVLLGSGKVADSDFHALMSKQKGVVNMDLSNYHIPREVLDILPDELIRRHLVFPVDKLGKLLTLAMVCPVNGTSVDVVEAQTSLKVKPMLCSLAEMRQTIRTHCRPRRQRVAYEDTFSKDLDKEFGDVMDDNEVAERIFGLNEPPPPLSHTVELLASALKDPNSSLPEVTDIVSTDPVAALRLLNVSNSSAYGLARRVDSLGLASTILGGEAVYQLLKASGKKDYFENGDGFDYRSLWQSARFRAASAKAIGEACGSSRSHTAQTASLLADIGQIGLLAVVPKSYPIVCEGKSGQDLVDAEERLYRVSHPEIGYMMARKWNLPPALAEAIRFHRRYADASKSKHVVALTCIATHFADAHISRSGLELGEDTVALDDLRLNQTQISEVFKAVSAQMAGG